MAKKRSKKQKIKAQKNRRLQLLRAQSNLSEPTQVGKQSKEKKSKPVAKEPILTQDKLLGFDVNLIKRDLVKTGVVSFVIMLAILILYLWL